MIDGNVVTSTRITMEPGPGAFGGWLPGLHYFENNGGNFTDRTQEAGFTPESVSRQFRECGGCGWRWMGRCSHRVGPGPGNPQESGRWDVSTANRRTGAGLAGFVSSINPADMDGDGDLDLYISRYVDKVEWPFHICGKDELLLNDGRVFEAAPPEAGLGSTGCGLSTLLTDIDGDGDLDILVANDFGFFVERNYVYRNLGDLGGGFPVFEEVGAELGLGRTVYGMGLAALDSNRDGQLDYYLTSIGRDVLLEATGSGGVYDATESRGLGGRGRPTGIEPNGLRFPSTWMATVGKTSTFVKVMSLPTGSSTTPRNNPICPIS